LFTVQPDPRFTRKPPVYCVAAPFQHADNYSAVPSGQQLVPDPGLTKRDIAITHPLRCPTVDTNSHQRQASVMHDPFGKQPVDVLEKTPLLLVEGLSKLYQSASHQQQVLTTLDLTIHSGEIVALIGASGSGKTTLLNLISGIDTPDGGRVLIDGLDLHAQGEPQRTQCRRSQMGFVFQFFNLIPTLTVAENIALPLELNGASTAQQRQPVADLLRQIGLPHTADRYPDTLSGGEQQRVAIARALAHRPRLLLADEPTGNLDEDTGNDIMTMLVELVREQDTALLLVTHSSRVAEQADRVLQLSQGRLLQVQ